MQAGSYSSSQLGVAHHNLHSILSLLLCRCCSCPLHLEEFLRLVLWLHTCAHAAISRVGLALHASRACTHPITFLSGCHGSYLDGRGDGTLSDTWHMIRYGMDRGAYRSSCLRPLDSTNTNVVLATELLVLLPQYEGRTLAAAHAPLVRTKGLNLSHFDAVSEGQGFTH